MEQLAFENVKINVFFLRILMGNLRQDTLLAAESSKEYSYASIDLMLVNRNIFPQP